MEGRGLAYIMCATNALPIILRLYSEFFTTITAHSAVLAHNSAGGLNLYYWFIRTAIFLGWAQLFHYWPSPTGPLRPSSLHWRNEQSNEVLFNVRDQRKLKCPNDAWWTMVISPIDHSSTINSIGEMYCQNFLTQSRWEIMNVSMQLHMRLCENRGLVLFEVMPFKLW